MDNNKLFSIEDLYLIFDDAIANIEDGNDLGYNNGWNCCLDYIKNRIIWEWRMRNEKI